MKTRSGRELSDADIERLAAQAEGGVDLARWRPRKGRPSIGTAEGGSSPRIGARVSEDVYRRASSRAAAEGKSISQVVRDLLDGYVAGAHRSKSRPGRR